MRDGIFEGFLKRQEEEGQALAQASDLVELERLDGVPTQLYHARFRCKGLVRPRGGDVRESDDFRVAIWFPSDYLRRADPFKVLAWLEPREIFHPNISDRLPVICVGRLTPGTPLVDLLYQCFEIITYRKVTMREDDALNRDACAWARENQHRFPIDRRLLKRRTLALEVHASEG